MKNKGGGIRRGEERSETMDSGIQRVLEGRMVGVS